MPDGIAYWKDERSKVQQQLDELETGVGGEGVVSARQIPEDTDRGFGPAHRSPRD